MRTDIYEILDTISQTSGKKVLATIVNVDGSAYKKAGSMMLFDENGKKTGLLSGGCLEEDLLARSKDMENQLESTVVTYDLSAEDDLSWGQGVGCNGMIKVVLENLTPLFTTHLKKVRELIDNGQSVTHIKKMTAEGVVTDYLFFTDAAEYFGEWKGDVPNLNEIEVNKLTEYKNSIFFKQEIPARPRLFIYGAGIDAIPLAHLAHLTGFQVIVADWRPAYCHEQNSPFSTQTKIVNPKEFAENFSFSVQDSIVLMTHHFQKDLELLSLLLKKRFRYLGILGSKDRAKRLLNGRVVPDWVHFPVGLDIGAEGPHEIAISIMAELIHYKTRRRVSAL